MHTRAFFIALALGTTGLAAGTPAAAQNSFLPATPVKGVWLEATHTRFKGFEAAFPSAVWYAAGRLPLNARLSAVVDLPFSHAEMDLFEGGAQSSTVLGNPYLGVELAARNDLGFEIGTRLPLNTADEESFADVLAFVADPLRPEAFLENMVPLLAGAVYRRALPAGFALRTNARVAALFHTGEESADPDAALDYGVLGSWAGGITNVGLGVSGRWYTTSDDGNLAETSFHHAGLTVDARVGPVRPGVSVRVPLDSDYRRIVKSSVGLYLQVPVR